MNPAISVVLLTTLSGLGQGLFTMTLLGHAVGASTRYVLVGSSLALAVTGLGLVASFFHLGRPERGWRAIAQWRTSWLSREVIALPLFMAAVALYWLAVWTGWPTALGVGAVAFAVCVALWVCTGMIYICIRFVQEWASPLTLANFVLMGLASGALAALNVALFSDWSLVFPLVYLALALTVIAAVVRVASLARNARLKPKSTLQTAIGIRHPKIAQAAMGGTGETFNTREFSHGRSLAFVRAVKWLSLGLAFAAPALLLALSLLGAPAIVVLVAAIAQWIGLLLDRWFFFAQARHPQNLYYQLVS